MCTNTLKILSKNLHRIKKKHIFAAEFKINEVETPYLLTKKKKL